MVSSADCAITPRVSSATSSVASGIDVTKWVAPNSIALSRLSRRDRRRRFARLPRGGRPGPRHFRYRRNRSTTTVSPGQTSAVLTAEPQPVITPHPSRHARDSGRSSSTLITDASDSVPYCEKLPTPAMMPTSLPLESATEGSVDLYAHQYERAEIAQVLVSAGAPPTPTAGREERRHHVIADGKVVDAWPDLLDDARALVPADHRQWHPGEVTRPDVVVGVAQASRLERDQDLAVLRSVEVDFLDGPVLVDLPQHRGVRLHVPSVGSSDAAFTAKSKGLPFIRQGTAACGGA